MLKVEEARVTLAPKLQRRSNAALNARQLLCYMLRNTRGRSRYWEISLRVCGLKMGSHKGAKAQRHKEFGLRRVIVEPKH